eukprot:7220025-Alexandrium_andersonii.AAC.1
MGSARGRSCLGRWSWCVGPRPARALGGWLTRSSAIPVAGGQAEILPSVNYTPAHQQDSSGS